MSLHLSPQPLLATPFITQSQVPRSDLWLPKYGRFRLGLFQTLSVVCARSKRGSVRKLATMATTSSIKDDTISQVDDTTLVAQNFIFQRFISLAFQTIIELGIPGILARAEERKPMSAEEILQQLPTKSSPGPTSVRNLQRLLSPLVREGLFSKSLDGDEAVYGLTKVSQWFVRSNPLTATPMSDLMFSPVLAFCDRCLPEVILDETTSAFIKAYGVPIQGFNQPDFGLTFQKAMESNSNVFLKGALDNLLLSGVLDGVNTLVDVGGGRGHLVSQVVANNPRVQGINFDLPHVVATAPAENGVQQIGGSLLESVPSGDAMFLKWIIHNYGGEEAIQILKNCYKALPAKNGKIIIAEFLKGEDDDRTRASFVDCMDLVMLTYLKGARERSIEEYQALLAAAGFPRSSVTRLPDGMAIIQGFKE